MDIKSHEGPETPPSCSHTSGFMWFPRKAGGGKKTEETLAFNYFSLQIDHFSS